MTNEVLEPKYEMIPVPDKKLYQIRALKDFTVLEDGTEIHAGDLGGFISGEWNLSQSGTCWISENSRVINSAKVTENAQIRGNAIILENAKILGNSIIYGATVCGRSYIAGDDMSVISGINIKITGDTRIRGPFVIRGSVRMYGRNDICPGTKIEAVTGDATITIVNCVIEKSLLHPEFGNSLLRDTKMEHVTMKHNMIAMDSNLYKSNFECPNVTIVDSMMVCQTIGDGYRSLIYDSDEID